MSQQPVVVQLSQSPLASQNHILHLIKVALHQMREDGESSCRLDIRLCNGDGWILKVHSIRFVDRGRPSEQAPQRPSTRR